MRILALAALIAACAGPEPAAPPPAPAPVTVRGTVTSVDLEPLTYDGDALIELVTDDGAVTIRVPARTNLCQATGLELVGSLQSGDAIEVRGERADDGSVTPCASSEHGIRRLSAAGVRVYRGVFESGFETSAFRPCDQPDARWWLAAEDPAFFERFEALAQEHGEGGGRGLRLVVEATVVGELTDEGEYGHLGQYRRRLTVTETREMVHLATNPVGPVGCRR